MDYTITPSSDGTFIILKVRGEITRRTAMQPNLEAHALGERLQISRYLVDVTEARNTDDIWDNYEFAYSDMKKTEGINKFARVATLVSPDDHSHDFMETVARNAGLIVKTFIDLDQAMRFLLDNHSPNKTGPTPAGPPPQPIPPDRGGSS